MPLQPGERLGPYEILGPIGAGGMGEVYRARDTRLHRNVALKVLPDDLARDPWRRQRFEREARAVAALNHPNIVAAYDVGENFLVSELVEGQTLRQVGKLSQRQAIDLSVQIAEGLAAAHAAGITHRDLKPANIMITRDGRAKILDFGLAKMMGRRSQDSTESQASTETQDLLTDEGVVMGTVGYMSPEQVRGLPTDHRSDIFSFGVVMYEMLSAGRAFTGESSIEVMNAILKEDPSELSDSIPTGIKRIVEHCIEKNPDRRFQSTRDLAFALQSSFYTGPQTAPVPPLRWRRLVLAAAGGLVIAFVSIVTSHAVWPTSEPPPWSGGMLGGPEIAMNPRPSPDGHLLAFEAMIDGLTQVVVMKPESANWSILTQDRTHGQASNASWSPDGAMIYYNRSSGAVRAIYSVPVLGGDERLVLENAGNAEPLRDGTLIVTKLDSERQRKFHRFWPGTGKLEELKIQTGFSPSQNTASRAFPDGKTIVIWGEPVGQPASARGLYVVDLASGSMKRLSPPGLNAADVTAFAVAPDGQSILAVVNSSTLTRIVSYPASGAGTERPLFTVTSTVWYLDASPDGSVYTSMMDRPSDLVRFSLDGTRFERFASFPVVPEDADIMTVLPDGRAVVAVRASGQSRLMVVQQAKDPAPLVNTNEETMAPLATCGSGEVVFMIGPAPHETLAFTEPATGRIVRRISPDKGPIDSVSCSLDGRTAYFSARGVIWSIPSTGGDARNIRPGDRVITDSSGRRLIVQVRENSQLRLFSVSLDGGPDREIPLDQSVRLAGSPLSSSGLSTDGRLLVPLAPRDSWFNPPGVIDTATGHITRIPSDNQGDYRSMGWTRDGRVLALRNGLRATLWKFRQVPR